MQKKSLLSILVNPFMQAAAAPAMPMRELSATETTAVAGGPELDHMPEMVIEPPANM